MTRPHIAGTRSLPARFLIGPHETQGLVRIRNTLPLPTPPRIYKCIARVLQSAHRRRITDSFETFAHSVMTPSSKRHTNSPTTWGGNNVTTCPSREKRALAILSPRKSGSSGPI